MHVHRGVFLFRSSDPTYFYVEKEPKKGQLGSPYLYTDTVRYEDCTFLTSGEDRIIRIVDRKNGNTYYTDPSCQRFQD